MKPLTLAEGARFWSKVRVSDDASCWEWTGARNDGGYGRFRWKGSAWLSHRFAFTTKRSSIPRGLHVCHKCDNPPCCNPAHLFLGTAKDNVRDMIQKGRATYTGCGGHQGEANPFARLTEDDVRRIRRAMKGAPPGTARALAQRLGVNQSLIYMIANRTRWKCVPDEVNA